LTSEKRAGYLLFLRQADMKAAVKIDEKTIYDYYKANKSTMFRIAGKTKVSRIFLKYEIANREETQKKIEQIGSEFNVDNFAQKARQYSQDEKATAGGDWGYWDWQGFSSPEQQLIERLPEKQISSPIDTGAGFSVLLVTEKVAEQQESYDQVKERIRNILENEALAKKVQEKIQDVYGAVKEEKNLRAKASLDKVKGLETGLVLNGDPIKDVDPMGYVSRRLFTLKLNEISSPFETPEGAAIVQLLQVIKPRVMDFAEAKEKVCAELTRVKKIDLLMAKVQRIASQLESLKDEKKLQEFMTKEKVKPVAEEYRRGNQLAGRAALSGLDEIVFNLPDGKYSSPIAFSTELVLLKVKSKSMVSAEDFNKNRVEFAEKKLDQLKNEIFSSYILQRRNAAKIFYNSKVYEQTKEYILGRI
jgi:parvulin-like peptidyl-prolyl isomerase